MEVFLIVAYKKLRKSYQTKKIKPLTEAQYAELVSKVKLVHSNLDMGSKQPAVAICPDERLCSNRLFVGNKKSLSMLVHPFETPTNQQSKATELPLVDLNALALEEKLELTVHNVYSWVMWKQFIILMTDKFLASFKLCKSLQDGSESVRFVRAICDSQFRLQEYFNDSFDVSIGSGTCVNNQGVLAFINSDLNLVLIKMRDLLYHKSPEQVCKVVKFRIEKPNCGLLKQTEDGWYVVSNKPHKLFTVSSKTSNVIRSVKLQMQHAEDSENIFAIEQSGESLVVLSHYDGGNNTLHASCYDLVSGNFTDSLPMNGPGGGFGIMQTLAASIISKKSLLVIGMSRAQIHLIGCSKGRLKLIQSLDLTSDHGAGIYAMLGRFYTFQKQEYFVIATDKKINVVKLVF